jgi:hypothetical protein
MQRTGAEVLLITCKFFPAADLGRSKDREERAGMSCGLSRFTGHDPTLQTLSDHAGQTKLLVKHGA